MAASRVQYSIGPQRRKSSRVSSNQRSWPETWARIGPRPARRRACRPVRVCRAGGAAPHTMAAIRNPGHPRRAR
jgi:hypothetical protein